MKSFEAGLGIGLIVGVIVGAMGAVGILRAVASKREPPLAPTPTELTLPEQPAQSPDELAAFVDAQPFEVGYYAKDLASDATQERFAERSVCLASMVKLFCLTELFRQVEQDGLKLQQPISIPGRGDLSLEEAAGLMIGLSDNEATAGLADFVGREAINRIPDRLGIEGLSPDMLPPERGLRKVLDKRIFGDRIAPGGLPQHGSAKAMADFLTLLVERRVFDAAVSDRILTFLARHPKPFSLQHADEYAFSGKGGNILWTRPPAHYSMMGWALIVGNPSGTPTVLCVWGEWFPEDMPPELQSEFLIYVTDSLLTILAGRGP